MKLAIKSLLSCLTLIAALNAVQAGGPLAPLPTIGPFTGTASETWEVFTNGSIADFTPIMGGNALIGIANNAGIYQPGVLEYNLGNGGNAEVADGAKGYFSFNGSSGVIGNTNLGFTQFGAFWGANLGTGSSSIITVVATDVFGTSYLNTFAYTNVTGTLIWQGWSSTVPLVSIVFSSDATDEGLVFDGLQGNFVTVPEPNAIAVFGIGVVALIAARQLRTPRRS